MTPADLAAALGAVIAGHHIRGGHQIDDGETIWELRARCLLVASRGRVTVTTELEDTTTLPAAVAHVRAMLAVETPKEIES